MYRVLKQLESTYKIQGLSHKNPDVQPRLNNQKIWQDRQTSETLRVWFQIAAKQRVVVLFLARVLLSVCTEHSIWEAQQVRGVPLMTGAAGHSLAAWPTANSGT